MTGLFFALVGLVYEKAHSREIFKMGGFGAMMPGIATAFTIGGLSSLGLPATAGFVAEFLTFLGAWSSAHQWWLFPGVIGAFLTSIYVLRVAKQIFWGPKSDDPHFQNLPDAQGTGMGGARDSRLRARALRRGAGHRASRRLTRRRCRCSSAWSADDAMTFDLSCPLAARELALFALAGSSCWLVGLGARQRRSGTASDRLGDFVGLLAVFGLTFVAEGRPSLFDGTFVQDSLALFAKRLFLASAALSVLGSLTLGTHFSAARGRVPLRAAGVAARDDGPRVGARAHPALRRVRADVDSALPAHRVPEARRRRARSGAQVLPRRHGLVRDRRSTACRSCTA